MPSPRWRLPDAPLRTSVVLAIGYGSACAAMLGSVAAQWVQTGPFYVTAVLCVFGGLMIVALGSIAGHHPFRQFGPANHVTMFRAVLLALAAGLLGSPNTMREAWLVVCLAALAAGLDGVDGWLARRHGTASRFGARFDMEIDALLILVLSALVWQHGKAGAWVLLSGLMRYAFVAGGWALPWLAGPLRPTLRGKTVAVGQLAGLAVALAPVVAAPTSSVIAAVTLAALTWSFALDVHRLWQQR